MKDHEVIQNILNSIHSEKKNDTGPIYLNVIGNEFITLNGTIQIPMISVKELDYGTAREIIPLLVNHIPEFLNGHHLLEKRKPASEQHSLHFVRCLDGRLLKFVHILKIDLMFGGDSSTVTEKGNTDLYPAFATNRLYYKSKLIPVLPHASLESGYDFEPLRLKDFNRIQSDNYFHTYAIFDDLNTREISKELCKCLPSDAFTISLDLYPFITYDYFTACLNVLYPDNDEIMKAVDLFEPLFGFLYSQYKNIESLLDSDQLEIHYGEELEKHEYSISLKKNFQEKIKNYFHRYSLFRDEEMMVKGWRCFKFSNTESPGGK